MRSLSSIGCPSAPVRVPDDLDGLDGLVIPGGESTTISMLLESSGVLEPLQQAVDDGLGVFGTCAGMILASTTIEDGRDDQHALGIMDIAVQRNGYGRQRDSFEVDIDVERCPFHAVFIRAPRIVSMGAEVSVVARYGSVFIRAPRIVSMGAEVSVVARYGSDPVLVRQGRHLMASFHPELTGDARIHEIFVAGLQESRMQGG